MKVLPPFALIVATRDRAGYLHRLLDGVRKNDLSPGEVIIVNLGADLALDGLDDMDIQILNKRGEGGNGVSTAAARNFGAEACTCEHLVFMDDACIPSKTFFRKILSDTLEYEGLAMGNPRYLLWPVDGDLDEQLLLDKSVPHPYRPIVERSMVSVDYELFHGPCCSIDKGLFFELGGFSEDYSGNGAGDMDLAFRLRDNLYPLALSSAPVYYQHGIHSRPLDSFSEIVANCRVFYRKWGKWPLQRKLSRFVELKLIDWSPDGRAIRVLSDPAQQQAADSFRSSSLF